MGKVQTVAVSIAKPNGHNSNGAAGAAGAAAAAVSAPPPPPPHARNPTQMLSLQLVLLNAARCWLHSPSIWSLNSIAKDLLCAEEYAPMTRTEFLLSQTQGGSQGGQIITNEQKIRDDQGMCHTKPTTRVWSLGPTAKGEN